jgi:hypothetical protein
VLITARGSSHGTSPEQQRELLAHVTARGAHYVAGIGEQSCELGHCHLHTGLLGGLPDGGLDGGLADVDAAARQLPRTAVTPAHEEQSPVQPPNRDEDRGDDEARGRRRRIMEVHLARQG